MNKGPRHCTDHIELCVGFSSLIIFFLALETSHKALTSLNLCLQFTV